MTLFNYHVSQEQFSPSDLLDLVREAERAGFDGAFSSDHAHPWAESQGHCGFTWSWLGAAMARTDRLRFGAISVPGGWRYNPAVLAQAVGTLGQMFPGRLPWIALGSGQLLNEHVTGEPWPDKALRTERLAEGAAIMRALLAGERVTRHGLVTTVDAQVWSRPAVPTLLMRAATTPDTARRVAAWSDGLLTVSPDLDTLRGIVEAFRAGGGHGKPIHLKVDVSWAATEAEALGEAHRHWRFNALGSGVNWDLRMPEDFEAATRFVRPEDMRRVVKVVDEPAELAAWLAERAALGFESIDVHQVGADQRGFIDVMGGKVLPLLRADAPVG